MAVVSLAISQERQQASHLRLLQDVWTDRDYPQIEAFGREGQDGDSWSKGYFATGATTCFRRCALRTFRRSTSTTIRSATTTSGRSWKRTFALDRGRGPSTSTWPLGCSCTAVWGITTTRLISPSTRPERFRTASASRPSARMRSVRGSACTAVGQMDFGPPILVPLHAPAMRDVAITAGRSQNHSCRAE